MKKEYLFKIFVVSLALIVVVFTITQLVFYAQKFNSNIKIAIT